MQPCSGASSSCKRLLQDFPYGMTLIVWPCRLRHTWDNRQEGLLWTTWS